MQQTAADVVDAQELHATGLHVDDLGTWAARNRWRPHILCALQGTGHGAKGGVGVFVREGAAGSVSAGTIWPGRAIAVEVDFGGPTPIVVVSLYLITGGRLSDSNLAILGATGASVAARGLPFVVAGDFQV